MKKITNSLFYIVLLTIPYSHLHSQTWLWGRNGVSTWANVGSGISDATDKNGNVFMAGYFRDSLSFDSYVIKDTTPYSGSEALFLVKYNPSGSLLWIRQSEGHNNCDANGFTVSTDKSGNAYVTICYYDTIILGSFTLHSSGLSTIVAKYDPNGNVLWAKQSFVPSFTSQAGGNSLSTDNSGNVYVTGIFYDTVSFGTYTLVTGDTNVACFLVKYNSVGNVIWAKQSFNKGFGGAQGDGVITDDYGNEYVSGFFTDTLTLGTITLTPSYQNNISSFFLVKYDSLGNVLWAKENYIDNGNLGFYPLTTDKDGNLYETGWFTNSLTLGTDTLKSPTAIDFFVAKYTPAGNLLWAKQSTTLDSNEWLSAISSDRANHLYLSLRSYPSHTSKIVYDNDTISYYDTAKDDYLSILMQIDTAGNLLCHSVIGGGGEYLQDVAADSSGQYIYLAGTVNTPVIFGPDSVWPVGEEQFPFVARWLPCGDSITTTQTQIKKLNGQVSVYPSPNNGEFIIALQNVNEPAQLEVYNVLGEEICQSKLNFSNTKINLGPQPEGIYFYRTVTESGELVGSGKVIIKK